MINRGEWGSARCKGNEGRSKRIAGAGVQAKEKVGRKGRDKEKLVFWKESCLGREDVFEGGETPPSEVRVGGACSVDGRVGQASSEATEQARRARTRQIKSSRGGDEGEMSRFGSPSWTEAEIASLTYLQTGGRGVEAVKTRPEPLEWAVMLRWPGRQAVEKLGIKRTTSVERRSKSTMAEGGDGAVGLEKREEEGEVTDPGSGRCGGVGWVLVV